jgi:hypothetical protein
MSLQKQALKWNRVLSWLLASTTLLMAVTGYGITRSLIPRLSTLWFILRDLHIWVWIVYTILFIAHTIIVETVIRSQWFTLARRNGIFGPNPLILIKLMQKITGYLIFLISPIILLTGLNFHLPLLAPFFPVTQHIRWENYLIILILIHVITGVKTVLIRRQISNRLYDYLLLLVMIGAIVLVFFIDSSV